MKWMGQEGWVKGQKWFWGKQVTLIAGGRVDPNTFLSPFLNSRYVEYDYKNYSIPQYSKCLNV